MRLHFKLASSAYIHCKNENYDLVLDGHGHEVVELVHAGRVEAHDGGVGQLLKHGLHHPPIATAIRRRKNECNALIGQLLKHGLHHPSAQPAIGQRKLNAALSLVSF